MQRKEFAEYREVKNIIDSDDSASSKSAKNIHDSFEDFYFHNKMTDNNTLESLLNVVANLQEQVQTLSANLEKLTSTKKAATETNDDILEDDHNDNASERTVSYTMSNEIKHLKSYLELITEFEGNNISVETFIFEIKTVLEEIPEDMRNKFIRLIISKKIVKQARKAIDGCDIRSSEDLIQILRNNFGETKSFDIATLERSQCQQGNDNVILYSKRFNDIHLNVKRAITNNPEFDSNHRKVSLINEERQGLVQYIRGLRPSIKLFVKAGQPKTIREAQNLALETEKEEITTRLIHKKTGFDCPKVPQRQQNIQSVIAKPYVSSSQFNTANAQRLFPCHGCGSTEHFIKNCPNKQTNLRETKKFSTTSYSKGTAKQHKNNKEIIVHANRLKYANISLFQNPSD